MKAPLEKDDFNRQVRALIAKHGPEAFAALPGQYPQYTLFVEGDRVIAEGADSPKHRYGVFFERPARLTDEALAAALEEWLESGEAFDHYMSMNVCRYNC